MYYPPLFTAVRPFDPRANPEEVPVVRGENPLDLSVKTIRPSAEGVVAEAEELMMLDHRKLANLAASHSLSAMGRQLIDPSLYRLGYGPEAAVIPGLASPFCFDRTTGVAVPTSLAGHQMMSSLLQQRERLEQQQQQAFFAARNSAAAQQAAVAQQQAVVAAAAAAYMDPANLSLHLRNGLTQREAAAALAATRGMYAPSLPTPMMLPAFSLYTEDKGAFTSLRNAGVNTTTAERNIMNGVTVAAPTLDAARYAEHLQRLRGQHLQQHQTTGKCSNACCSSNTLAGLGQSSVPCACCVQTPSQSALCARSPMGCSNKDPTPATTGKICDFPQPGLSFLHRPTATTSAATSTAPSNTELRLSVSSLCTTQSSSEPTTVSSSRDKHHSVFRPALWNAGLPSVTTGGKTAFSVPKKKDSSHKESSHHSKEHRSSGSIKDILKDTHCTNNNVNLNSYEAPKSEPSKLNSHLSKHDKHDIQRKMTERYSTMLNDGFSLKYNSRESVEGNSYIFNKNPVMHSAKSNNGSVIHNGNDAITTVTSINPIVTTRCEGGSIPVTKMPPLLEAVRPSDIKSSLEQSLDSMALANSPQGPPPLIAVSSTADYSAATIIKSPYVSSENTPLRLPSSIYPNVTVPVPAFKPQNEKTPSETSLAKSSASKSPKKTTTNNSLPKFNGVHSMTFLNNDQALPTLAIPKPIPTKPIPQLPAQHLTPGVAHYSSHYRPGQHQLSLQTHNEWIPHANPNVTVAPLPQPVTTTTVTTSTSVVVTNAHRPAKPHAMTAHREPDYADTPNVLQSLLIRSSGGMEPPPPSTSTESSSASVITSTNNLPLFSIDYRFPIGPQVNLVSANRDSFNNASVIAQNCATVTNSFPKDKAEVPKSDRAIYSSSQNHKQKKRSSGQQNEEEIGGSKKRALAADFNNPMPRYSFQPAAFVNEVSEAPECPYTFIPEPPLNFASHLKVEGSPKPFWRDLTGKPLEATGVCRDLPKSPVLVSAKSPSKPTEPAWSPHSNAKVQEATTAETLRQQQSESRLSALRARRRLRKRLLARICQQRRPLPNVVPDREAIEKQLTVRYARKLLSQLTLRWAHRRYIHKWNIIKKKRIVQKKGGFKSVCRTKGKKDVSPQVEDDLDKTADTTCNLVMPPEMKRLIVNKALGETQLHRAARLGYSQAVAYCLKSKCVSVNARDNAGYTPLHECCSRGHLDIARALLQYGADVNAAAAGGIRPLHDAVENDHVEIVRLLLSYGADPTITTYSGLEPIKLARSAMMAEFMQGFLADISGEVDCRPHLPWRFWGSAKCLDPEDNGYDVFSGVPTDPESDGDGDNDFLFEVSDSPHLPTFRLLVPSASTQAQCNYLRLNDVLRKLSLTKEEFLHSYGHIEVLALPRHEFESCVTCSPLLSGQCKTDTPTSSSRPSNPSSSDQGSTITNLVRLDKSIRKVLGIETISLR